MKKVLAIVGACSTLTAFAQDTDVNIDVNMGGMGIDMNVNINESYSETHTTTTTTTTTTTDHYVMQGYNGAIGCAWPMDESEFANAERSIGSKTFSDSKMTMAKQVTGANCLTVDQVKRIMMQFDFEDDKLEYAKFAYDKTYDISNYYKLNDAFDFESTIEELDAYINGR